MTLDEAFDVLSGLQPQDPFPAMQCLLDAWDVAGPRCRALLQDYVQGRDVSERTEGSLFFVAHLLGEKADTASFEDFCALAGDPERGSLIFGEAYDGTLPQILVSCFNGDVAPPRSIIESRAADPFLRGGALLVVAYLTATKRVPRPDTHAYLSALFDRLVPQDDEYVWFGWVMAVGLLGFGALAGRVGTVFDRGLIPAEMMRLQDFRADLQCAMSDPASLEGFDAIGIGPLGSAIAAMEDYGAEDEPPVEAPYVNPIRGVRRHNPCPCGSGKKFKKCCLAA